MGEKEFNISFEPVWGFDPDRVIQAVGLPPSEIETEFTYSAEEQRAARIPSDLHAQVYELRRMYRL
jgi:hypothetical protein